MTDTRPIPKFFERDKLLRDEIYRVIGRVILKDDKVEIGKPIAVILLTVPRQYMADVRGKTFYIDGIKYKVPIDLPDQKIGGNVLQVFCNNFWLQPA
jgi:hypothetical protein